MWDLDLDYSVFDGVSLGSFQSVPKFSILGLSFFNIWFLLHNLHIVSTVCESFASMSLCVFMNF